MTALSLKLTFPPIQPAVHRQYHLHHKLSYNL